MPWRRRLSAALAAFVVLAVCCGLAAAVPPDAENGKRLEATVAYLQRMQNADGGFGFETGAESDPLVSAWVAYALASFGVNPRDQAKPGGVDAHTYLTRHTAGYEVTTDWERMLLVAVASCTPARDFGGLDLVARILARRLPGGSFTHEAGGTSSGVNDTAFAVLAISLLDDAQATAVIGPAAEWLRTAQFEDGSWGWSPEPGSESVDMTGAVIQALIAGGRPATPEQRRGFEFLRGRQNADGGFPQLHPGEGSNVASTAWAVQGLWAAGIDPRTWSPAGRHALDYLGDRQQPDGSIQYRAGEDSNNLWMSAQVAPAFAGHPLPIACVPLAVKPPDPPPAESATPAGPPAGSDGQGGLGERSGSGVIAGGGGAGAPLFSRPKPQSRGRTPGGEREVDPKRARAKATPTPAAPVPLEVEPPPAAATPTATATVGTPTPTPAAGGRGGDGPGLEGEAGGRGGGAGGLPYVTGTLVSSGAQADLAAAPGLRGAGAGGSNDGLARIIAIALLGAALAGWTLETRPRRRG